MSIFSNPFDGAVADAEGYIAAVLELVGERPALEILAELPSSVDEQLADLTPADLDRPEAPGRWSIRQVVHHLADSEVVWGYRLRRVLADDGPLLSGYDQDAWSRRLRYDGVALETVRQALYGLRALHVTMLGSLSAEERQRSGRHSERSEETVSHMMLLYAGHDLVHRRQLVRIRRGLSA